MENLEQLDGLYMTALQKAEGINNFFDSFFGFLSRKSDFFSSKDSSWNIVESSYKKYLTKHQEKQEKERKKQQQQEEEKRKLEQSSTEKAQPKVKELTKEEFERAKMEEELKNKINNNPELKEKIDAINKEDKIKTEEKEEDKVAEGKIRPNKGNGANLEKYFWYQYTIQEITIMIPVDKKITGKDVKIKNDSKHLSVVVAGETIINGELKHTMNSDSFMWVLDDAKDGKIINITFDKLDSWKWWECIIKGDQEIDTSKINPEPSKLSDLDGDIKGQVEKMMFDTRQKQMGLPSSDELKKQEMLKKFMDAHPEMDFSKAKFG